MKSKILTLAFMLVLPLSTWQVFNPKTNTLIVYSGDTAASPVFFTGKAEDYKGGAAQSAQGKWTASWLPSFDSATSTPSK